MASAGCGSAAEFTHGRKDYGSARGRSPRNQSEGPGLLVTGALRQDSFIQARTHLGAEQFGRAHATGACDQAQ
jgi:hypothetical protein